MSRYRDTAPEDMSAAQRRVRDLIISGRRGSFEAIRRGESPSFGRSDEALVHRVCTELFNTQRLSDAVFAEASDALGETGLVEIIAIIGYHTLIGNTLNASQVPVPEGVAPPFPE